MQYAQYSNNPVVSVSTDVKIENIKCLKTKSSGYLSYAAKLCEFRALEIHNSGTFKLVITFFSCSSLENP